MNPVALITGASRGIGRGIAVELAGLGYDLVINYLRSKSGATQTRRDCIAEARTKKKAIKVGVCQADIAHSADRKRLVEYTKSKFGRLDLLVNNAGIPPRMRQDILKASETSFEEVLATNLKGPYFLTQLAGNWMISQRREDPERKPKIVFITSISAEVASVNRGEYCISKAGLSMASKLFATRLADYGINVYEIRPGIIETDMVKPVKEKYDKLIRQGISLIRRWGKPEDVGKIVAAIAQDLLSFSTGEIIYVDGGFHIQRL